MNARKLAALAAFGSVAMLLGALAFQYIGNMAPCKMCYWQRYAHVGAVGVGVVAVFLRHRIVYALGAIAAAVSSGLGGYHAGVEQKWWQGPTTCTSQPIGGLSTDDLLNQIMNAPVVRCDDISWQMMGISMAGWNMIISAGLVVLWLMAYRRA